MCIDSCATSLSVLCHGESRKYDITSDKVWATEKVFVWQNDQSVGITDNLYCVCENTAHKIEPAKTDKREQR